jgi:hypothetical protein
VVCCQGESLLHPRFGLEASHLLGCHLNFISSTQHQRSQETFTTSRKRNRVGKEDRSWTATRSKEKCKERSNRVPVARCVPYVPGARRGKASSTSRLQSCILKEDGIYVHNANNANHASQIKHLGWRDWPPHSSLHVDSRIEKV